MKTLSSHFTQIPCPLCNECDYKIMYRSTLTLDDFDPKIIRENLKNSLDDYTKHGQIVRCTNCSLVYVNPREQLSALRIGYEDVQDPEYITTEKFRKILLTEHLKEMEKWQSKGNLLDIGCFAGYFLSLAKKHGWHTYGIEPSRWAVKIAKKQGTKIVGKNLESTNLKPNYFDAITLWDVIEHLSEPKMVITKIYKSLKPGGIVALGTPNVDSLFAKILKERCPFFIRMHLVLYSPRTMKKLLEENGFSILSCTTYGRIFPLSYVLERIQIKNYVFQQVKKGVKAIPFLANLPLRIDFKDSFLMIAKKI